MRRPLVANLTRSRCAAFAVAGFQKGGSMLPFTAEGVATTIATLLDQAAAERGRATLAIPGGRSPGPVLAALAGQLSPFVRERLHLLWVDERAVPVDHPDRNDGLTLAAWKTGGRLPAHVHSMPAENPDLEAAAQAYTQTLHAVTAGDPLDVALLGIGEDGHIASLFPDHPGLDELDPVFAIADSPKPPPRRLSLSFAVLSRSRANLVLALGEAKGSVYRAVREGEQRRSLPVSLLPRERTTWYLDDAAAAAAR
jgi:6-phosphogluconolactonase